MEQIFSFIQNLFSINTILFTLLDYPMSYIEFFGTVFTVWCVWLTARTKVLSWPIGIIGTLLYIFLFYQINLYSDLIEQVYFLVTGFVGWYTWSKLSKTDGTKLEVTKNSLNTNLFYGFIIVLLTILFTFITTNLDNWFPVYFPESASFPILDAFTTSMSFVAQWLLTKKKLESWVLWIVVDTIGIWLYWTKGVKFISLEYVLFLGIAIKGYMGWRKETKKQIQNNE